MDVRMTRVSWPATGTPSAMAGMAMRASQPPGSAVSEGSGPEAGSTCSIEENSKIMSTASQNDGVAMQAMENTRMIWSGHRIPIQGRDHAEDHCDDHADDEAEERQLQRDGQSFADAIGHRGVVRAVGAEVALYEADDEVTVLHEDGIVQSVLLAILLGLGFSGVLAKDRIRLVDRRECMMKKTRMVTPKIMIGNAMRRRPINRSRLLTVSPFRFVGSKARLH